MAGSIHEKALMLLEKTEKRRLFWVVALVLLIALMAELVIWKRVFDHSDWHIQERLTLAAQATTAILGDTYHDGLSADFVLSREQQLADAARLTQFASESGYEFVYTLVQRDGEFFFASSSLSPEELTSDGHFFEDVFRTPYEDAPPELFAAYATESPHYASYQDRWGAFVSIFVPLVSADGTRYVVGADLAKSEIVRRAQINGLVAILPLLMVLGVGAPLLVLVLRAQSQRASSEISKLKHDPLTGLPNRPTLLADLEQSSTPILFLINIDRFREITNTYGPACGDQVLEHFADHLRAYEHPEYGALKSYRLQGDEFVLLLSKYVHNLDARKEFTSLYDYLNEFHCSIGSDQRISLTVSVGGAMYDQDILLLADMALRHARIHRQGFVIYDRALGIPELYRNNLADVERIRAALREGRVVPFFQPIFELGSDTVSSWEVLARLVREDGSVEMSPAVFFPVANRYQLHQWVTRSIIESVLDLMASNQHRVSLNLSIRDVENPATVDFIVTALRRSGMGNRISFELLENESLRNRSAVIEFIHRVQKLGCRVGIDDLGKEYSNFDRMMALPIDFLKIDGSVIQYAATDSYTFEIVRNIVKAARARGVASTAEFINSAEVLDVAVKLDVDLCQGFYLGKPHPNFVVERKR